MYLFARTDETADILATLSIAKGMDNVNRKIVSTVFRLQHRGPHDFEPRKIIRAEIEQIVQQRYLKRAEKPKPVDAEACGSSRGRLATAAAIVVDEATVVAGATLAVVGTMPAVADAMRVAAAATTRPAPAA